jgi:hypothetical protein
MIWLWRLAANRRVRSQQFLRLLALRGRKCEPSDRVQLGHRAGGDQLLDFSAEQKIFRDLSMGPNFQSCPRAAVDQEEEGIASRYITSVTREARKTKQCGIKRAKETFWPAVPPGVGPAVLARGCDIKPISASDECSLRGTALRFYRAIFRPTMVLRSESEQHRFHRWSKKGKINNICFSGHCCELVVDPYFPSL